MDASRWKPVHELGSGDSLYFNGPPKQVLRVEYMAIPGNYEIGEMPSSVVRVFFYDGSTHDYGPGTIVEIQ